MDKRGFTIIELVIVIALIGITAFIVAAALSEGISGYFQTSGRSEALDQSRVALERMSREMRNARIINSADASQFCFRDVNDTKLRFVYSGSSILREEGWASCSGASGSALSSGVSSLGSAPFTSGIFAYVLTNGTVTETPAVFTDITRVMAGVRATSESQNIDMRSEVYLRNR